MRDNSLRQRGRNDLFLPLDVRRNGNAGRLDDVHGLDADAVGITPDEQQQLGRRSFRSQRHQAKIPGSGLGFWIASTFVRANGGTIDISSQGQGLGTTATIILPGSQMKESELSDE